jgi:hypothetical protein
VKFGFVAKHRGIWPAEWLCGATGVSRGGLYAWLTRPRSQRSRSDEELGAKVRASFLASDRTYGARRVWHGRRITAGEDKAYDTADHVANLRASNVTPHVTQNNGVTKTGKNRQSAIDERTTRHEGYGISQSRRAMIECIFGWGKQHGTMRKTRHRGICRVAADFMLNLIALNLIRIPKLIPA